MQFCCFANSIYGEHGDCWYKALISVHLCTYGIDSSRHTHIFEELLHEVLHEVQAVMETDISLYSMIAAMMLTKCRKS